MKPNFLHDTDTSQEHLKNTSSEPSAKELLDNIIEQEKAITTLLEEIRELTDRDNNDIEPTR